MPRFCRCTECNGNGVTKNKDGKTVPCDLCAKGSAEIGQTGWVKSQIINAYYKKKAETAAQERTAIQLAIFKAANLNVSNTKVKAREKLLMQMFIQQELAQFKSKMISD